ncbi:unnamed protein product, partial [Musa hybrid cultivar]
FEAVRRCPKTISTLFPTPVGFSPVCLPSSNAPINSASSHIPVALAASEEVTD